MIVMYEDVVKTWRPCIEIGAYVKRLPLGALKCWSTNRCTDFCLLI